MHEEIDKIIRAVQKGKILPVYLFYGEQDYLVEEAEKALIDVLVKPEDRALNLVVVDGSTAEWSEIVHQLKTPSLFGGRKVVVVNDPRLAGGGGGAGNVFKKAKEGWREGTEAKKTTAVKRLLGLIASAGWGLDALAKGGESGRSEEDWKREFKINLESGDLVWLEEVRQFALTRGLTPKTEDKEDPLVEYLQSADANTSILVLTAVDVDKRLTLFKAIEKAGVVVEFSAPKGDKAQRAMLKAEVDELLAKHSKKIESEAFLLMERKTGFDLRMFVNELEKVIAYVGGRKTITSEDVEAVVKETREESLFNLTDALARRDAPSAIKLLADLLEQDHHPLEIIGAIHREIRNLYLAKGAMAGGLKRIYEPGMFYPSFQKNIYPQIKERADALSSLHPYAIYKALENQKNFDLKDLEDAIQELTLIDLQLKSTRLEPQFILERFIFKFCGVFEHNHD